MKKLILLFLPIILLVGCATAPPPMPPAELGVRPPEQWGEEYQAVDSEGAKSVLDWVDNFGDGDLSLFVKNVIAQNHDLKAVAARIQQAIAERRVVSAGVYPELDAGLNAGKSQSLVKTPGGSIDGFNRVRTTTLGLSLDLSWEADVWGRLRSKEEAAMASVQAVEADYAGAKLSLAGQAVKSWFAAVEKELQLKLAEEKVSSYRKTVESTRDRFASGLEEASSVYLVKSELAKAEAEVEAVRIQHKDALRDLEILTGNYPKGEHDVAQDFSAVPPMIPVGLPSELLERRPDVVASERRVASAMKSLDSAEAARLPKISLTASGGTASDALLDILDPKHDVWSFLVNLARPVFDGGRIEAGVDLAQAQVWEATENYRNTALTAFREVESALTGEKLLVFKQESMEEAFKEAQLAYERAKEEYFQGVGSFLKVLETQRAVLSTESALLSVKNERLANRVNLHLALGGSFLEGK